MTIRTRAVEGFLSGSFRSSRTRAPPPRTGAAERMGRRHLYTMGEVAALSGLTRQTLHAWALRGLLRPVLTTPGGRRYFSGGVFRRIEVIRALRASHTLDQVRDLLEGGRSR